MKNGFHQTFLVSRKHIWSSVSLSLFREEGKKKRKDLFSEMLVIDPLKSEVIVSVFGHDYIKVFSCFLFFLSFLN